MFNKKEKLDLEAVKRMVPLRAPKVEEAERGEEIMLTVRRSPGLLPRVLSWFFTVPVVKNFTLDRFGVAVWRLCDGRNTVGEVMRLFPRQPGWPEERTEASVLQFLLQLSEKRLVSFAPPGREQPKMR